MMKIPVVHYFIRDRVRLWNGDAAGNTRKITGTEVVRHPMPKFLPQEML